MPIVKLLLKYFFTFFLFLLMALPVFAGKPSTPGNGGGFTPIPNSVCIDPGHGGSEIGSGNGDLLEKNVNLEVANKLSALLVAAGYTVFQTRTDDNSTLSNADRYNYCNTQRAAILVSVHHNGSADTNLDYSTALYMKKSDVALAQVVVDTISSQLGLPNRGISRFASGVLLKADMPATISEGFFLTNTTEADLIKNSNRLDQEAQSLFTAIESYLAAN